MGLKLKGQMLLLFLFLYVIALAILIYFNVTLLTQANTVRAQEQARSEAIDVLHKILELIPQGPSSQGILDLATQGYGDLAAMLDEQQGIRYLELFDINGQIIFRYGRSGQEFPRRKQALGQVVDEKQMVAWLWGYGPGDALGEPLESVNHWSAREVTYELFAPVFFGPSATTRPPLNGVVHISLEVAYAPLRIKLVVFGNLVLSAIFLVTALLALNLWGEHAINRPLKGLVAAQAKLESDLVTAEHSEFYSNNELVNLYKSFHRVTLDLLTYQREVEQKTVRLEQANQRYKALNERLEQEVEDKTREMREFFSLVTHDLRIPLAAIQGYTDLLQKKRDGLEDRQLKFVRSIAVANSHALELVRNLLDAMKYEFGQPRIVPESFGVAELVDEVASHLSFPEQEGRIDVEIAEGAELVFADRTRLSRVLTNLLANALRHSEAPVRLTVRPTVPSGEDLQVEFEVVDEGPGIPEDHLALLFQKFTQFPSEAGPSSGLGLGLYIVRRILEGHGSEIRVESVLGEGTRFWFRLSRSAQRVDVAGTEDSSP